MVKFSNAARKYVKKYIYDDATLSDVALTNEIKKFAELMGMSFGEVYDKVMDEHPTRRIPRPVYLEEVDFEDNEIFMTNKR